MILVADTNWLVAAYFVKVDETRTEIVKRFGLRFEAPWIVSPPVHLESRNVFAHYSKSAAGEEWSRFKTDVGHRIAIPAFGWDAIAAKSEELCNRFSVRARLGTMDLMILAAALKAEATHFLSFDTNSNLRALAARLKLKVYPDLTPEDKRRMAAFR